MLICRAPVLLLMAVGALQCLGEQPVQAFVSVPRVLLRRAPSGLQAGSSKRERPAAITPRRLQMQLGFPRQRREVQQSREYNVAKVRGGY